MISTLAAHYASGDWAASDVLDAVLDRIASYPDKAVWIDLLPPAAVRAQVRRAQDHRAGGAVLPLFGVPFAVKDNIDVEGRQTTAACPAFAYPATESATVVRKLCNAGAILVGKTNLDQFATGLVGTRSPYGACRNPFDGRYISGGSSSGSAVAVAAGLVSFALGTDTAGSGRVPAAFNNIVGWKPTRGRLSTAGFVPACRSIDCPSVFALTCEDAMAVARVASGLDTADPYSRSPEELASGGAGQVEFTGKFRIGIPPDDQLDFFGNGAGPVLFRQAVQRLEELGGVVTQIDYAPFLAAARLLYDGPWVAERLAAVRSFYSLHADDILPVTRAIIGSAARITAVEAFEGQYELRRIARLAQEQWRRMDVLLLPTAGRIYTIDDVQRDPVQLNRNLGYYTNFVNLLDLCAVAVPNGFEPGGLPAGVTLIGPMGTDDALLKLAGRFHRATGLTLGAIGSPLPPPEPAFPEPATPGVQLAVVGAHLSGMPLNHQLTDSGGTLVRACKTAARYRLYALPGTVPPKPGLVRVATGGGAIDLEVWELSPEAFGKFVAAIPPPLGIGTIELEDGSLVKSFLCESYVLDTAPDITALGGWRQYVASRAKPSA